MADETLYQTDMFRPLPNDGVAATVRLQREFNLGDVLTFWFVEIGGRFMQAAGNPITVSGGEIDATPKPLSIDTTRRAVQSAYIMVRRVAADQIAVWKEGNADVPLALARISARPLLGHLIEEARFVVSTAQEFVATGFTGWGHFRTLVLLGGQQSRQATGTLRYGSIPDVTNTPAGRFAALATHTTALDETTSTSAMLAAIDDADVAAANRLWLMFPISHLELREWNGDISAGIPGFTQQADYTSGGVIYTVYSAAQDGVGAAAVTLVFRGRDSGGRRGGLGFLDVQELLEVTPAAAADSLSDANSVIVGPIARQSVNAETMVYAGRTAAGEMLITTQNPNIGFYPLKVLGR